MLDTFRRKVSVLSDTPLQGIWMFLPFSGHFLYPANHICGLPQSNKKQEKDKIPGPAFISIHTVKAKLLFSVTQSCYIASPSLTNLRGCVTYFWWDWRRGGWVGCEWQIWLRSFASSAERGGTGGWGSGGGEGVTRLAAGGGGKRGSVLLLRLHFSTCQWSSQQFITLSDFSRSCVGYIHGESQLICIILTSKREDRLSVCP